MSKFECEELARYFSKYILLLSIIKFILFLSIIDSILF